jgi:hypothetical protein
MADEPAAPRRVLVLAGHLVDAPARGVPRFPPERLARVTAAVEAVLDTLRAGPSDLAFTQGASGGDLILAEACVARGVRLQLVQPLPEQEFLRRSVLPSADGAQWAKRYRALRRWYATPPLTLPASAAADCGGASVFERCNVWMLGQALAWGADKLTLVCLWDGGDGDGSGGTRHLVELVRQHGSHVEWIDLRRL